MAVNTNITPDLGIQPFNPQEVERQQWLEERRKGIGSSDAASLYSEGYGCYRRLTIYDKRNVPVDFERTPEEEARMTAGTKLEDVVAREFIDDCNAKLRDAGLPELKIRRHPAQVSKDNPDLRANIDRRFVAVAAESLYHLFPSLREALGDDPGCGIMEVKTTEQWKLKSVKEGGASLDWILQVQEQFAVVPDKWAIIVAKARDTWETLPIPILPDAELIADISRRATEAMAIVRNFDAPEPPPLPDPKDKRCGNCQWRRSCRGEANQALNAALIKEIGTVEVEVDDSEEFVTLLNDYKAVDFQYEDMGTLRDILKDKIKKYVGDRPLVRSSQAQVLVKHTTVKGRESVDSKALKNEMPDVYAKFLKTGAPSKRFEVVCE